MHRNYLLGLMEKYVPSNFHENEFQKQIREFVMKYHDCFERSLDIGHITASAWLLNNDGTKALLMHHAKLNNWFQLGGHCDGDWNVLRVAIKEAQEESGINAIIPINTEIFDIDVHPIPATRKEKEHYHYDIRFLLQITSEEKIKQNNESKELRWISKNENELPTQSPSVIRMFHKWVGLDKKENVNKQKV
jgi:8-oxo-dGTP pyrophosphatase MutT (NUDIX family)